MNDTMTKPAKQVVKKYGEGKRVVDYVHSLPDNSNILVKFWHGLGDLLMFMPIFTHLKHEFSQHHWDLAVQAGVDHEKIFPEALVIEEKDLLRGHDICFDLIFPMSESANGGSETKAEKCYREEIGLNPSANFINVLPNVMPIFNKMVAVHFQGTCLPGSTNPDDALAKQIWDDIIEAGYIPIDVHFKHLYHNSMNKDFEWANRNCRDLKPSIQALQNIIQQCFAFVGVASGPFVLAAAINRDRTIYLQKGHHISCYMKDFENVIDLNDYKKGTLSSMLGRMLLANTGFSGVPHGSSRAGASDSSYKEEANGGK